MGPGWGRRPALPDPDYWPDRTPLETRSAASDAASPAAPSSPQPGPVWGGGKHKCTYEVLVLYCSIPKLSYIVLQCPTRIQHESNEVSQWSWSSHSDLPHITASPLDIQWPHKVRYESISIITDEQINFVPLAPSSRFDLSSTSSRPFMPLISLNTCSGLKVTHLAERILWSTSSNEELWATWNVPNRELLFFLIFSAWNIIIIIITQKYYFHGPEHFSAAGSNCPKVRDFSQNLLIWTRSRSRTTIAYSSFHKLVWIREQNSPVGSLVKWNRKHYRTELVPQSVLVFQVSKLYSLCSLFVVCWWSPHPLPGLQQLPLRALFLDVVVLDLDLMRQLQPLLQRLWGGPASPGLQLPLCLPQRHADLQHTVLMFGGFSLNGWVKDRDGKVNTSHISSLVWMRQFVLWTHRPSPAGSNLSSTCSSSSSAYFCRLLSFPVPSRSSRSRWASCLAELISFLSCSSTFTFSTWTQRCSSWACCSLTHTAAGWEKQLHADTWMHRSTTDSNTIHHLLQLLLLVSERCTLITTVNTATLYGGSSTEVEL